MCCVGDTKGREALLPLTLCTGSENVVCLFVCALLSWNPVESVGAVGALHARLRSVAENDRRKKDQSLAWWTNKQANLMLT